MSSAGRADPVSKSFSPATSPAAATTHAPSASEEAEAEPEEAAAGPDDSDGAGARSDDVQAARRVTASTAAGALTSRRETMPLNTRPGAQPSVTTRRTS